MRLKRRCLHVGAAVSWTVSAAFLVVGMLQADSHVLRLLLIFVLTVAATLTSAGILVSMLAPMRAAYRAGFRDGAESTTSRPKLTVVRNEAVGDRWF